MKHNKKIGLLNVLFLPVLLLAWYSLTFIRCSDLFCIDRIIWGYRVAIGCLLLFSIINAVYYKKYKPKTALFLCLFWSVLLIIVLCDFIIKSYT